MSEHCFVYPLFFLSPLSPSASSWGKRWFSVNKYITEYGLDWLQIGEWDNFFCCELALHKLKLTWLRWRREPGFKPRYSVSGWARSSVKVLESQSGSCFCQWSCNLSFRAAEYVGKWKVCIQWEGRQACSLHLCLWTRTPLEPLLHFVLKTFLSVQENNVILRNRRSALALPLLSTDNHTCFSMTVMGPLLLNVGRFCWFVQTFKCKSLFGAH